MGRATVFAYKKYVKESGRTRLRICSAYKLSATESQKRISRSLARVNLHFFRSLQLSKRLQSVTIISAGNNHRGLRKTTKIMIVGS